MGYTDLILLVSICQTDGKVAFTVIGEIGGAGGLGGGLQYKEERVNQSI